jgi:hypothetical protein
MFSILFCRSLAVACGGVLAIATGVLAGLHDEISVASLWDLRALSMEADFSLFWRVRRRFVVPVTESIAPKQLLFAQLLFVSAALLAVLNFGIAVMGWRTPAALRGVIAHLVITVSLWLVLVRGLAGIWVLHWLNFWVLLILPGETTRLSF